mgnify:CR=1 FL=1
MKQPFRRGVALLSSLLMTVGAGTLPMSAAKSDKAAGTDVVKIACIGASTVRGAGAADGTSWPSDLQLLLGGLCEVRNFGVDSRTVLRDGTEWNDTERKQKLAYTLTPEYRSSLEYDADIVLIMLGVNDAKPINWRDGNNTFEEDYEALVNSYRDQGAQVILIKDPWVRNTEFTITEDITINQILPIYQKVADKYGLKTIDLHTPTTGRGELYSDGVHPNSAGYQFMAEIVAENMKKLELVPAGSENVPCRPVASIGDFYGEYDGYTVMQWKNGTTGNFNYTSGMLASQLGIEKGTVVQNLTIDVSYFWDGSGQGNNWWHFNTTDKNGQSAPAVGAPEEKPHDNGYGQFTEYGMKPGSWETLTVSRDEQLLGGAGSDWYVNVGGLSSDNSLYIRGFEIRATLADGTVRTMKWGVTQNRRGADDGKTLKIACVGMSTTRGNNVPSDKGTSYPAFLKMLLGSNCEVKNFGYPGCSVTKGRPLSYIGSTYYEESLAYKADVVIIDMGGNDSQPDIWKVGTFQKDYDELVSAYIHQGNNPLVLLSTGGHCTMATWGTDDQRMKDSIQPAQLAVAAKYGLPTADLRALLVSDPDAYICKEDGVHYTDVGHQAMAQLYYDALLPMIEIPGGGDVNDGAMMDPTESNVPIGEYDGYRCLMWEKGQTGAFSYNGGGLAFALGVEAGTIVEKLEIRVSYYFDCLAPAGDWWHFNTTDKDGLSAPSYCKSVNPAPEHDNGFGHLEEDYELVRGQWSELVVLREKQLLGSNDWMVSMGLLGAQNSLYFRGYTVRATLADGTVKEGKWGAYAAAGDKTALQEALDEEVTDLSGYTAESTAAYKAALKEAKAVADDELATQAAIDAAVKALTDATAALTEKTTEPAGRLGDINNDGKVDTTDARLALQHAVEKLTLNETQRVVADVNNDGKVDTTDARLILQYAVEKIDSFPAEK